MVDEVSKKDKEISDLQSKLTNADTEKKLELSNAVHSVEKARDQLINDLKHKDTERELLEKSLNEKFKDKLEHKDETLKLKDEEIHTLKDYKQNYQPK